MLKFAPRAPGQREGAVVLTDTSGTVLLQALLSGVGIGPTITYSPNSLKDIYVGDATRAIAVDAKGRLFTASADESCVALNGAGNVYIGSDSEDSLTTNGPNGTHFVSGVPSGEIQGVAVDPKGNVFVALIPNKAPDDSTAVVEILNGSSTYISLGSFGELMVIVVDGMGNVYVDGDNGSSYKIILANNNQTSKVATGANAHAITVDGQGNLYYARGSTVMELPVGAKTPVAIPSGVTNTIVGLAVDGLSSIYTLAATGEEDTVVEIVRASPPSLAFKSPAPGTESTPQTVTVQDFGKRPLHCSNLVVTAPSSQQSASDSCSASTTLAAGSQCGIPIVFAPTTSDTASGTLTVTDDAMNARGADQQIKLRGVVAK